MHSRFWGGRKVGLETGKRRRGGIYVQEVVLGGLAGQRSSVPALINSRSLRVSWEAERSSCLSNHWGPTGRGRGVRTSSTVGLGEKWALGCCSVGVSYCVTVGSGGLELYTVP